MSIFAEVYQLPPAAEWNNTLHSVQAILRDDGYLDLKTASAVWASYFKRTGWFPLYVTAEAKIYVLEEIFVAGYWIVDHYVDTYKVTYQVQVPVGITQTLTVSHNGYGNTTLLLELTHLAGAHLQLSRLLRTRDSTYTIGRVAYTKVNV